MLAPTADHFDEPLLEAEGEDPAATSTAGCILPPALKYPFAIAAGVGRALNAFGSLDSINSSLIEVFNSILPFASPEVQSTLGRLLGFTFCSGNALMSSMSEVGKILETTPSTDDHSADASSGEKALAWILAGANGVTTGASAFNGLRILFSSLLGDGAVSDIVGAYFGAAVFISSSYFNTQKNLKFSKMGIPDLRDTSLWSKYMAIGIISMITNGAMTAYQVSTLLCGLAGITITAGTALPITIIIPALLLAGLSDANLYYTEIPATKITFAKAEAEMIDQIHKDLVTSRAMITPADRAWLATVLPESFGEGIL